MKRLISHAAARSGRRLALGLGVALIAGALLAPPATAVDHWSGVWNTRNQFGSPKLELDKDGDTVKGKYRDDHGAIKGKIKGELTDVQDRVWTGTYKDNEDKGKFRVELQGDNVSFEGWFKSCGALFCSEKYDWTGQHA